MNFQTSDDPSPADLVADDEVLRRLRREPALIEVLWTKYAQRVFRYLSRRVGHAAAEDLLSDVFVAALDARSRVVAHDSGSALPWLYGIAHNIVRHHLRTLSTDHPIPPAETAGLDWASVDARLDAQSQRGQLRTALSALSEVERELFLLVAWEGLTPAKAAKILGITGLAARSRLHRARRRAQQAFIQKNRAFRRTVRVCSKGMGCEGLGFCTVSGLTLRVWVVGIGRTRRCSRRR